ncbi:MAG: hypothetical protein AWU59_1389 [Methanolobus sp. T82-4]|jgi:predicted transcriptional regulator|nr:MAG: hypothetical protein AWU59_1389 [Methanolobus sp. T82-4]
MSKSLIDIIFTSEKRKCALLLLKDGPLKMDSLLSSMETKRQALLPQMKVLTDNHLIYHHGDEYELTVIGEMIVDKISPLLNTVNLFDTDIDYWGSHDIDFIPPHLLERVYELGQGRVIKPSIADFYEVNTKIVETTMKSKSMRIISSFIHPDSFNKIEGFVASGVEITIIITRELYEKLRVEHYDEFKLLLENEKIRILLYPDKIGFIAFTQNAYCNFFRLLLKEGLYDNMLLFFCNPEALEWGNEFFEFYLKDSTPINEIEE